MKTSTVEESADFLASFDDDFFADYDAQLEGIDLETQAQEALAGILTLQSVDGKTRTLEQIKQETEVFFENPWVRESMVLMDNLSQMYAHFCNHNHEATEALNTGMLDAVYARGSHLIEDALRQEAKSEQSSRLFSIFNSLKNKVKEKKKPKMFESLFSRLFAKNVKFTKKSN